MEGTIVKKDAGWLRYKTPRWVIGYPKIGGELYYGGLEPASFKTEKAVRRFLTEKFPTITVVN